MLRLPPPIWAMIYLGVLAGVSAAMGAAWTWPAIPWLPDHEAIGMVVFFGGWVLPVWAFFLFRREVTELDPLSESNAVLVTHGPYSFTRNPMYLGLTVATLGMAIWVDAWPMLLAPVLLFATAAFVHVPFEEAKMRRQYGAAYDAYAARVRRWL